MFKLELINIKEYKKSMHEYLSPQIPEVRAAELFSKILAKD